MCRGSLCYAHGRVASLWVRVGMVAGSQSRVARSRGALLSVEQPPCLPLRRPRLPSEPVFVSRALNSLLCPLRARIQRLPSTPPALLALGSTTRHTVPVQRRVAFCVIWRARTVKARRVLAALTLAEMTPRPVPLRPVPVFVLGLCIRLRLPAAAPQSPVLH